MLTVAVTLKHSSYCDNFMAFASCTCPAYGCHNKNLLKYRAKTQFLSSRSSYSHPICPFLTPFLQMSHLPECLRLTETTLRLPMQTWFTAWLAKFPIITTYPCSRSTPKQERSPPQQKVTHTQASGWEQIHTFKYTVWSRTCNLPL